MWTFLNNFFDYICNELESLYFIKISLRTCVVLLVVIIPSWGITRYLTHHSLINNEQVFFSTISGSGGLNIYYKKDSKIFSSSEELKKEFDNIAKNRLAQIAGQILNIDILDYQICNQTPTFVSISSGTLINVGNTKSLDIILKSYRTNKNEFGSYIIPPDEKHLECRDFGKIGENDIDSLTFPNSDFPYYGKDNVKGYVFANLKLVAVPTWQATIMVVSFIFVGNFWITVIAGIRFIKKGLFE